MKRTAGPWPLSRYESSWPFNIAVRSRMPTITAPIRCVGVPLQDSVTPRPGNGITASARSLLTLAAASDLPLAGSGAQHDAVERCAARHGVCLWPLRIPAARYRTLALAATTPGGVSAIVDSPHKRYK